MLRAKIKTVTTVIVMTSIAVTGVYAAGRIYTNRPLDELKRYVDNRNLNIQVVDTQLMLLDARHSETTRLYNESKKQTAILKNQIDRLNHDRMQHPKKMEQQKLIERHKLQIEYYRVCLLIKRLELTHRELELTENQIIVEEEKLNLGDSTQFAVDDLRNRQRQVQENIVNLIDSIKQGENTLKARLNERTDVQFDPLFVIPSVVDVRVDYTLEELKTMCRNNNLSIIQLSAYIGFDNTLISSIGNYVGTSDPAYSVAVSERSSLKVELELLNQQIDIYVEGQYNAFKQSHSIFDTLQERKGILNRQLDLLTAKFDVGDLSELQYLTERFLILKMMNDVYVANVELINALSVIDLIENGIIMGGS